MDAPISGSYRKQRMKSGLGSLLFGSNAHQLLMKNRAVIMNFHRVDDRLQGNPISCTVSEFQSYCDFFADNFTVLPLPQLLDRIRRNADISNCLAITFDDGYFDNIQNAAPELEKRNLPATFFIATGFIGTSRQPWWDQEYGSVAKWMSWDDVRELKRRGFDLGAHTINHVDLGQVMGAEAREEIAGSKQQLEDEVGCEIDMFSYPYGRAHQITQENRELVRECGLSCCFSAYGGLVRSGEDMFSLQRTPVTQWHVSPEHLGFELVFRS